MIKPEYSFSITQSLFSLLFQEDKDIWLNAGLGFRYGDAVELLAGAE